MPSTRERIKAITLRLLAVKGYEGTALSEVAAACGIKTPSIYGHFLSKEDLFLEIWRDLLSQYGKLMEDLLAAAKTMPVKDQAFYLVDGYGTFFLSHQEEYKLWARLLMFPPPQFKERILEDTLLCEKSILERISHFISTGVERGEIKQAPVPDLLAAFSVLKEGYVQWLLFYDSDCPTEQRQRIWNLLWKGFFPDNADRESSQPEGSDRP